MSTVREATYRLLGERLRERLAEQADRGLTSDRDDELLLRLLGLAVDLHEWHRVDRYGRCRRCRRCRLRRRRWRSDSRRQQQCAVVDSIQYYLDEELHMIWWQVFGQLGQDVELQDVQEWVARQRQERSRTEPDDPAVTAGMQAVEGEIEGGKHRMR
ncbi:MAG: hypothetical protein ACRDT0_14785 [Pseudonocardiaceae bacterium]